MERLTVPKTPTVTRQPPQDLAASLVYQSMQQARSYCICRSMVLPHLWLDRLQGDALLCSQAMSSCAVMEGCWGLAC